jgi:acetoin utilization protein AcuB
MLTVNDVMTINPESVEVSQPVQRAINTLFELDARHLPVVDKNDELVGMLSDRDLREFSLPYEMEFDNLTQADERETTAVSEVMKGDVISVHPEDPLAEVVDLILEQKIGAVPVVDPLDGSLVGIVSYVDVLREARDTWEQLVDSTPV